MKRTIISIFGFLLVFQTNIGAQKFRTGAYSDMVKTLRVCLVDNWQATPIITVDEDNLVEVSFDVLGANPGIFTYTLTHCNADWTPDNLIQSEYMNGFQNRIINDYAVSFNTTMNYVNYRLTFPNEDLSLKISGNYAVLVFPENSDEPILCACFSVIEPNSDISMEVTTQTDKGMNNFFQQVNFSLKCSDEVKMPMQDLKVYVRQNERLDNEAALVKPLRIQNRQLFYEHIPALIFDAGNEYRNFEMTTHQFNGLNIGSIEYHSPYYHVNLKADRIRNDRSYSYYEDINGRLFVRTLNGTEYANEADYYVVHFFLPCERPFSENVYILSEAFNNLLDEQSLMDYSEIDRAYIKTALLKEGYYNYLYVTGKNNLSPAKTNAVEGNFYQTENEYRILVYFRRTGDRYDRLIGTQTIQFK
jgi:hypothetical protein